MINAHLLFNLEIIQFYTKNNFKKILVMLNLATEKIYIRKNLFATRDSKTPSGLTFFLLHC